MTPAMWDALKEWCIARAVPAKHARVMEDSPTERARLLGVFQTLQAVVGEMQRLERERLSRQTGEHKEEDGT